MKYVQIVEQPSISLASKKKKQPSNLNNDLYDLSMQNCPNPDMCGADFENEYYFSF